MVKRLATSDFHAHCNEWRVAQNFNYPFDEDGVVHPELSSLSVDSAVPNCCSRHSHWYQTKCNHIRNKVLPIVHFLRDRPADRIKYLNVDDLRISIDQQLCRDYSKFFAKLKRVRSLHIWIEPRHNQNLELCLPCLLSAVHKLKKLQSLSLCNMHRNIPFVEALVRGLYNPDEKFKPKSGSPFKLHRVTVILPLSSPDSEEAISILEECMHVSSAWKVALTGKRLRELGLVCRKSVALYPNVLELVKRVFPNNEGFDVSQSTPCQKSSLYALVTYSAHNARRLNDLVEVEGC